MRGCRRSQDHGREEAVLLGVRDDALAQLDVFKERIPGLFMNSLRLDYLDRDAGREAILGPLARYAEIAEAGQR